MITSDPREILHRTEQRRTAEQLELAAGVLTAFEELQSAEQALVDARDRYRRAFKKAARAHWKPTDLRAAGLPGPSAAALKARMAVRRIPTPDPAPGSSPGEPQPAQ